MKKLDAILKMFVESPDFILGDVGAETFDTPDAIGFTIDGNFAAYKQGGTHQDFIFDMIDGVETDGVKFVGTPWDENTRKGYESELDAGTVENWNRTFGGRFLAGRIFEDNKVISFWNKRDKVVSDVNYLVKFLKSIGKRETDYQYEFLDQEGTFYGWQEIGSSKKQDDLSDEEYRELLKTQHTKPDSKKELFKRNLIGGKRKPAFYDTLSRFSEKKES